MTCLCDEPEPLSCYDMGMNWWSATPRIQTSHVFTSLLVYAFEIFIKLFLCTLCLQGVLIHLFSAPSFFFKMALSYHLVTPYACYLQKRVGHPFPIVTRAFRHVWPPRWAGASRSRARQFSAPPSVSPAPIRRR